MQTSLDILLKEKGHIIHSIAADDSIYECAKKMTSLGVGALIILNNNEELDGIVSERDLITKLVGRGLDPAKVKVSEVMTKNLLTVTMQTTVTEAMRIMTDRRIRHLPVLDEQKKLVGLISIGDLTKWVMLIQEQEISSLTGYINGAL